MPVVQAMLDQFLADWVFAIFLVFVRVGTAVMIMPGIGDSFVSERIRLLMALGLSFMLAPVMISYMPASVPTGFALFALVAMELIIGLFFGTVARILMMALDTAGMVISITSGFSNAQLFNPALATQGSLMGAFMSITGVVVLFALEMHHLLISGLVESYKMFPVGGLPDTGGMAELIARSVSASFFVGIQIGVPFMVLSLLVYIVMGVLSRLMPQVQVFLLALPLQILLSLGLLMLVLSAAFMTWAAQFERGMVFFFTVGQ